MNDHAASLRLIQNEPVTDDVPMDALVAHAPEAVSGDVPRALPTPRQVDDATTRFAITADEFLAQEEEAPAAILGTDGETYIAAGSLVLMVGPPGVSKTTLTLDGIAHMGSGARWLDQEVKRPVRFLLVENEGSRQKFRQKLDEKVKTWEGKPFAHNLMIYPGPWGLFDLTDEEIKTNLTKFVAENKIDVVVCDTLDSIGMDGVGSPKETRDLLRLMKECGLFSTVAFWLLHHFNKGQHSPESLDKMQGAWGGHPDTVIYLKPGAAQETKLMWRKMRYATPNGDTWHTLKWDVPTRGFEYIEGSEPIGEEVYEHRILAFIGDHPEGVTKAEIEKGVTGKNDALREALLRLVASGKVENEGSEARPKYGLRSATEIQTEIPL